LKLRTLKLTPEQLIRAIQGKPSALNLPADLELLDIKYDAFARQVTAVVRSDSFEDVAEAIPIPEFALNTPPPSTPVATPKAPTIIHAPASAPTVAQPTISASLGAGVKTLESKQASKPEPSQDTGGLEDEFSKDQRKLLRFASDGDYVIVKPIQFLKTEWEDINDTVKSLGGQWVKGDIINYWLIPKHQTPQT
jgi:hypothetical protein